MAKIPEAIEEERPVNKENVRESKQTVDPKRRQHRHPRVVNRDIFGQNPPKEKSPKNKEENTGALRQRASNNGLHESKERKPAAEGPPLSYNDELKVIQLRKRQFNSNNMPGSTPEQRPQQDIQYKQNYGKAPLLEKRDSRYR